MSRRRIIALLPVVALLAGCHPPLELKSHTYDRERVLDRLLVVQTTLFSVPQPKVKNGFKTEFAQLLDTCGVPTAFSVNNEAPGKSLFADDTVASYADVETEKISQLQPTFVLRLKELRANSRGGTTITDLEAVLTDTVRKKDIWRASGFIRKTPMFNQITMEDFARGLVEKMRQDAVLRSCPANMNTKPAKEVVQ